MGICSAPVSSRCFFPTLRPGDVVVMDDLGSHKGGAVRKAMRAAGAHLLFLPPYSPDLSPIEHDRGLTRTHGVRPLIFVAPKPLMRSAAERTVEAAWKRLGT